MRQSILLLTSLTLLLKFKTIRSTCCCPSFVIAIAGPWIAIHGAILCKTGWTIQPLTDMINLQFDPYDPDRMLNIGRLFVALRSSLKELDAFYSTLQRQPASILWPMIRVYGDVEFQYIRQFVPEQRSKAVFEARELSTNRHIVVKFTNSYAVDAHRLLADANLAPPLLFFSGEANVSRDIGGFKMVVMEFIQQNSNWRWTTHAQAELRRAVDLLHSSGYVFGDLRDANILKLADNRIMLVDFDWCGKEGEVFYPMGLNMEINWHPGSGPGLQIERDHDLFMFKQISDTM